MTIIFLASCKYESDSTQNFQVGKYNLKVELHNDFISDSKEKTKAFYEDGSNLIKEKGYESALNHTVVLAASKGEFSSIKIKYYPIAKEITEDYENSWKNLKAMTYNILKETKIPESKIDSTSRIENIGGLKFYIFETNMNLIDLNNNIANFKAIKYSTPLDNLDLAVDVRYANQVNEKEILDFIRGIRLTKTE